MEQNAAARRERLIGLDEYLAKKYAREIRDLLEEEVFDGYDGSVSVRVKGLSSLEALALWQDGACEVGGLMRCSADCLIDGEVVPAECFLLVSCAVTATGVDCELRVTHESPRALMHLRGREKLDRYLLPRAGTRGVEKICDGILRRFCKEKLLENEAVPPEALAKALGLQLVRLPLRGRESVSSLLVTEDTRLLLSCPGPDGKTFRDVPSGTIVLNSAYRSMKNAESYSIAHECYHYAGQRLFRRFQQIAAAEYPRLKKRAGSDAYEDKARSFLEWQAHVGAQFLRYPGCFAREEAPSALKRCAPAARNEGEKYTLAINEIAQRRGLFPTTVCKVFRYQNHTGARGAFNYVNGGYIRPFAFDKLKGAGAYTYVIGFRDLLRLSIENDRLRGCLKSGALVYADGHVCVNAPAYVRFDGESYVLTGSALSHVDECCLRFLIDWSGSVPGSYDRRLLTCDDRLLSYKSALSDVYGDESGLIGASFKAYEVLRALPPRFGDTLRHYRKQKGLKQYELADAADMDERSVRRLENSETAEVSLCACLKLARALGLTQMYLGDFLRKARFVPDDSPSGRTLECILYTLTQLDNRMIEIAAREYEAVRLSASAEEASRLSRRGAQGKPKGAAG